MNKKFISFGCAMLVLSLCATIGTVKNKKKDIETATIKTFYAEKNETTTSGSLGNIVGGVIDGLGSGSSSGGAEDVLGGIVDVSDKVDNAIGGIGDAMDGIGNAGSGLGGIFDGVGDSFGGIFGGSGSDKTTTTTTTTTVPATTQSSNAGMIIPVPAATQATTQENTTSSTDESGVEGETVDYSATSNPYTKPTSSFVAGDEDETIKWIQWIFIYCGYGLADDGITGVLDDDTVAVIKKLQHENNMTVDGNINEDVVKAAEVLYYQSVLGNDVTAIEVSSEATTGEASTQKADNTGTENGVTRILVIVILVIIWIFAIGGIVLLFVFKKKKMNAEKKAKEEAEKSADVKDAKKNTTGISSLSDLFEEAEKKGKKGK